MIREQIEMFIDEKYRDDDERVSKFDNLSL